MNINRSILYSLVSAFLLFCTVSLTAQVQPVCVPPLPDKLSFAGERVPLEYFDVREGLERELLVTLNMHSRTMQSLLNVRRYLGIVDPILRRNGIPADFRYLCVAESGLDPNAFSSAGAAGLWQLMPQVGRYYGLQVDSRIDERYDIEMATEAACKLLKENYDNLGSWTLAAAAYNLGRSGVKRRIDKQMVSSYYDAFFPEETLRYVHRILSFKLLIENLSQYGYDIKPEELHPSLGTFREVVVEDKQIDWSKVAKDNGSSYKMLRVLNPWIRDYDYNNREGKRYMVRIPTNDFRN